MRKGDSVVLLGPKDEYYGLVGGILEIQMLDEDDYVVRVVLPRVGIVSVPGYLVEPYTNEKDYRRLVDSHTRQRLAWSLPESIKISDRELLDLIQGSEVSEPTAEGYTFKNVHQVRDYLGNTFGIDGYRTRRHKPSE